MHVLAKAIAFIFALIVSIMLPPAYAQTIPTSSVISTYTFADNVSNTAWVYVAEKQVNKYKYSNSLFLEQTFMMWCESVFGKEYCFIDWGSIAFTVQTPHKLDDMLPGNNMSGLITVSTKNGSEDTVFNVDVVIAEEYGERVLRINNAQTGWPLIVTAISHEFPFIHPLWQHVRFTVDGFIPYITYSLDQRVSQ
jgi:hypothetical protein